MTPPKLSRRLFNHIDNDCCRLMLVTKQRIADAVNFLTSKEKEALAITRDS